LILPAISISLISFTKMSQRRSSRGKPTKEKDKDHKEKCNGISKKDQDQWIILVNGNFIRLRLREK
jgi:hypothetical protein